MAPIQFKKTQVILFFEINVGKGRIRQIMTLNINDVRDMSYHSISGVALCRIGLFPTSNPVSMRYPTFETPTQREPYFKYHFGFAKYIGAKISHLPRVFRNCKVQCAFPMVISSEFRMRQHWNGDHHKDAHHFTYVFLFSGVKKN